MVLHGKGDETKGLTRADEEAVKVQKKLGFIAG
jgi:hypothetical protein